jgi:hypothetical protein
MILTIKNESTKEYDESSKFEEEFKNILSMDKIIIEIPVVKNDVGIRLLENLDDEVSRIYKKRLDDLEKNYYNWTMAGWYRLQEGSVKNIYSLNGKAMCYNCCIKFNKKEDVLKMNFGYIMSNKFVPTFLSRNFTRLFVICNKCENTIKPFPPPKTWQESIISCIYNEYESKTIALMELAVKNKTKKHLVLMQEKLDDELAEINKKNSELEQNITKVNKSIETNNTIMSVRKELLHNIISKEDKQLKILEDEEQKIRNHINELETNIIEQRQKLEKTLKDMSKMVTDNVFQISSIYNSSDISKVSLSLRSIDDTMCKACYDNEANIVLNPCGHVVLCKDCFALNGNTCPLCRENVIGTTQMFR